MEAEQTIERAPVWGIENCDKCGTHVRAKYLAYKEVDGDPLMLTFCLHHANLNLDKLKADGWEVDEIE